MADIIQVDKLISLLDPTRGGKTICLFGDSGDGKSTLSAELAEHMFLFGRNAAGKPLRARLYTSDEGGIDVYRPHIEMGIVETVNLFLLPEPWTWLQAIRQGQVLDKTGKWVPGQNDDIGLWIFESMTSMADSLRVALGGGDTNLGLKPNQGGDRDAHGRNYGLAQDRIGEVIKRSFQLPGTKIWTARARRGDDADTQATILGPQVVGKALTSEIPAWFNFTFRVMGIPGDELTKQEERHRLYLSDYVDQISRGAKGLGNNRKPLDGGKLPPYIEPASLVQALALIDQASSTATNVLRDRMRKAGLLT